MASLTELVDAGSIVVKQSERGDGYNRWGVFTLLYCGANVSHLHQPSCSSVHG